MSKDSLTDSVAEILRSIESWCSSHKVNLVYGRLKNSDFQIVEFDPQTENPNDEFLHLLDRSSLAALVVSVTRLSRERWQMEIDRLTEPPETQERGDRLRIVEKCEGRIGQIVLLDVYAVLDDCGLTVYHQVLPNWADAFVPSEEEEKIAFNEENDDPKIEKRIEDLARRLAEHARYPSAKNREQQVYLAESIFDGETLADIPLWALARRAAAIFEMDIKPKLEAALRDKAKQLRAAGNSVNYVADELGLSVGHVRRLLS